MLTVGVGLARGGLGEQGSQGGWRGVVIGGCAVRVYTVVMVVRHFGKN